MSESWKEQLEKIWCYEVEKAEPVKPLDTPKECQCVNFYNSGDVVTCNCDVKQIDKVTSEFGCSIPVRFPTSEGIKTMLPGKRYDENLNEILDE